MITAELIFGAATAVSAAIDLAGAGSAAASGAGLPYYVTMPASEVFAFTAEALLIAAICRPVLTAKQAVLLTCWLIAPACCWGWFYFSTVDI